MRREPSLTFEGALRILGKHEHKTIEKIDKMLGGVILGTGAVAGLVALGVTPLAPLAAFGVVWGWIEQKGLAVDLLMSVIDTVSGKVSGLRGLEKRELIAAAHSTIVVAAIFESLREEVGEEFYAQLKITDTEKVSLIRQDALEEGVRLVYSTEIPAPSAASGFEENTPHVAEWQGGYIDNLRFFLGGLSVAESARIEWGAIRASAAERYRSWYLELATRVPEFAIWANLGEHAATRRAVREVGIDIAGSLTGFSINFAEVNSTVDDLGVAVRESNAEVVAALHAHSDALNRITALLSLCAASVTEYITQPSGTELPDVQLSRLRAAVNLANTGVLEEHIIPADPERYPADLTIPRVKEIYINPRYQVTKFGARTRPADDRWWRKLHTSNDFDVLLTAHVTSPGSTQLPLLLLGYPGAGKSLLTKVLAARLPASEYTVVRVPLRRVSADTRVHRQIEEALEISTDQRISWSDLAEQSATAGTVRVVLLDGLDELLQASEHDRSGYLDDVVDFQEREANQRRPVIVIVTSRTVVADRVRIPEGTTIVKLAPFSNHDIRDWVGQWKRVNANAIAAGKIGELTLSAARRQPELAEQPLLLMMLALYAADRALPQLDEDMATAELYRRLLEGFARREAAKDLGLGHDPNPDELDHRVQDHLDRLAIAALAMFNRGRQDILEEELGKDLEALDPRLMERSRHVEAGRRIIGEFFFVHAPEARILDGHGDEEQSASANDAADDRGRRRTSSGRAQRAYEFLHATFGEYLVARRVMDELVDVAVKAFSGRRRGPTELGDDLLFALLSHQVLVVQPSILNFSDEIFDQIPDTVRTQILNTLEILISTYRNRHGSGQYTAYRPVPPDQVRHLACYSANLVTLRIRLKRYKTASLQRNSWAPRRTLRNCGAVPFCFGNQL